MNSKRKKKNTNKDKLIGVGSAMPLSETSFIPDKVLSEEVDKKQRDEETQNRCGKLLQDLGWGNGFRIPFATKDNQKLEQALEFKQRKILALRSEFTDNTDHTQTLEQHLARVKEDVYSYQNLLDNKKSIIENEKNFLGLAERMQSKILQEKGKAENKANECRERSEVMQRDLDRRLKGILELRDIIDFDTGSLQQYQDRLGMYDQDWGVVKKLSIEDEKVVRELEDSKVELGAQRRELRHELDQEAMNTSKYQEQFDRLSVEFRKVHRQRQEMISMWASTIQAMSGKDADMKEIADEYYDTRNRHRGVMEGLQDQERRLRAESCGISGTELFLSELDRRLGEIRRRIQEEKDLFTSLKDSCSLSQMEIQHACGQTKTYVENLVTLESEIRGLQAKAMRSSRAVQKMKDRIRDILRGKINADQRMKELDRILDDEENAAELLIKEMEVLRKYSWERSYDKSVTEAEIRNLETTTLRIQNNLALLQNRELVNMDYVSKRSSQIYRMDLDCSILENRISKLSNQSVDPTYFELQNTVRELKEAEKKQVKEAKYITSELEHVQAMTHKCNGDIGKNRREQDALEAELQQCDMHSHGLEKLMIHTIREHNDEQVRYSLERVYLKRLTDDLKSERQNMFGLAEIRNTINWAVKERKAEIENHRVLNVSRQKALSEVVSKLRVQKADIVSRTEKLKGRFELVTKLMSGSEDVSPEEQSLSYQVRKVARERETLQVEVQKWKIRLDEARKELEGMLNVSKIMQASNMALKDSLSPADDNSSELKELEQLNEQEKEILLRRNRAKKYRGILRDRMEELDQQVAVYDQEGHATTQLSQVKEAHASKVQNELFRQKEKVNRWTGMCSRLLREIRDSILPEQFDFIQKDLKLRFTISKFESAVSMLERLLVQFPYLKSFVTHYIQKEKTLIKISHRLNKVSVPLGANASMSSSFTRVAFQSSHNQSQSYPGLGDVLSSRSRAPGTSTRVVQRMSPHSRLLSQVQSHASKR